MEPSRAILEVPRSAETTQRSAEWIFPPLKYKARGVVTSFWRQSVSPCVRLPAVLRSLIQRCSLALCLPLLTPSISADSRVTGAVAGCSATRRPDTGYVQTSSTENVSASLRRPTNDK